MRAVALLAIQIGSLLKNTLYVCLVCKIITVSMETVQFIQNLAKAVTTEERLGELVTAAEAAGAV
jgi:mannitol/fructose-specific phosphotransferase system IIA component